MITTYKHLCDLFHLESYSPDHEGLKTFCEQQISKDIVYQGSVLEQLAKYKALAQHYFGHFLTHCSVEDKPIAAFNRMTTIQYAADQGYGCYLLRLKSASPKAVNEATPMTGMRPLHLAASSDYLHTIEVLLKLGADPTLTDSERQQPMFTALFLPERYDEDLLQKKEILFRVFCSVARQGLVHQDKNGDTVFHLMAQHGLKKLLQDSLDQEPSGIFLCNKHRHYPIQIAVLNNQTQVVDLLLKIPDVARLVDSQGRTALHYAAQYGTAATAQICCDANPELINMQDNESKTPLMLAVEARNLAVLQTLIERGADATLTDYTGSTILHLAINTLNTKLIAWILDHTTVDINQADKDGETPLAHLCHYYHDQVSFSKIEDLLLAHGGVNGTQSPSK